jgi:hypothetical protein
MYMIFRCCSRRSALVKVMLLALVSALRISRGLGQFLVCWPCCRIQSRSVVLDLKT